MMSRLPELPEFCQLIGGDNRLIILPVWMAEGLLDICQKYLDRSPRTRTPCYAAQEEDLVADFRKLIQVLTGEETDG